MKFFRNAWLNLFLAASYFAMAWAVKPLAMPPGYSFVIFPAAGLALGALWRYGYRLWPGVFLGAAAFHLANGVLHNPERSLVVLFPAMAGIGLGTAAQAVVGTCALKRLTESKNPLNRVRHTLIFIFVSGVLSCTISPTVGLSNLAASGLIQWNEFNAQWFTWWLGDTMGVLAVTPLAFILREPVQIHWTFNRKAEAILLVGLFYLVSQIVFGTWLDYWHYPLVYLLFPCLVWAAGRFGQTGGVLAIVLVSAVAVWGTLEGRGPFVEHSLMESLRLLQSYLMVLTIMTLVLIASVTETGRVRDQAAQLGDILDNSGSELYVFDAAGLRFLHANSRACENLGYSLNELCSMTPLDLRPGFSKEEFKRHLLSLEREDLPMVILESEQRRKDGSLYPVEERILLSRWESRPVFISMVQDTTRRKSIEKAFQQSEVQFQQLAENFGGVIWIYDWLEDRIHYISPMYEKVYGWTRERLYKNPAVWIDDIHPEDREKVRALYTEERLRTFKFNVEYRSIRSDGQVIWVWDRGFPIFDEKGNPRRIMGIAEDITERKRTEEELRSYRDRLEDLVRQRTADLETAHRQLVHAEKLSATGKMAASMAHEFNNPIYSIRSVLEKIQRRIPLDGKNARFVGLAIKECDRISQLLRKVLDFHSPSSEQFEMVDVHDAIEDMLLMMNKKFQVRHIQLVRHYDRSIPAINMVQDQIQQVILNLLQNAEEAITEETGTIIVSTSLDNGNMIIQVRDTGQGIQPENLTNIFDPFYTTKPAVKGTGLGLSVSYGIIKKHGGDIKVTSEPGKGSTFTVVLPLRAHETRRRAAAL